MATSARKSLLAQALANEIVDLVKINEVKFLLFDKPVKGHPVTLGVKGLSACSVIILASDYAAVLAHIGPNELGSQDPQSFVRLANNKMSELEEIYRKNQRFFGSDSHAYLIFATFQSKPTSPEQTDIYRSRLKGLGIPLVSDKAYERSPKDLVDDDRPEGTVWVVKRPNARPTVYLEDRAVTPNANSMPASSAQAGSSQPSSSQAANVSQPALQRPTDSYWVRRHGSTEYLLLTKSGQVLQRSQTPPQGVHIRLFDQNGAYMKTATFDGERWK